MAEQEKKEQTNNIENALPKITISTCEEDKVVASGSLVVPDGKKIYFEIYDLIFSFSLKTNSSTEDTKQNPRVEKNIEKIANDKECYNITFIDIIGPFATGPEMKNYERVAFVNNKGLFLSYCIQRINPTNNDFLFFYTWYLEK